jgi:hypothetical protein
MEDFRTLLEARSNPDLNPKVSSYMVLRDYYRQVSFTKIPKLGVNPQTKFNTPLGIYAYPLREAWEFYKANRKFGQALSKIFPYAADSPYMYLFRVKPGANICEMSEFNDTDLRKAVLILKKIYEEEVDSQFDFHEFYSSAKKDAKEASPIMYFWNATRWLSQWIYNTRKRTEINRNISEINKPEAIIWNRILRATGYDGFNDNSAEGYIHPNERLQAVILNPAQIEIVKAVENKHYMATMPTDAYLNEMFAISQEDMEIIRKHPKEFEWLKSVKHLENDKLPIFLINHNSDNIDDVTVVIDGHGLDNPIEIDSDQIHKAYFKNCTIRDSIISPKSEAGEDNRNLRFINCTLVHSHVKYGNLIDCKVLDESRMNWCIMMECILYASTIIYCTVEESEINKLNMIKYGVIKNSTGVAVPQGNRTYYVDTRIVGGVYEAIDVHNSTLTDAKIKGGRMDTVRYYGDYHNIDGMNVELLQVKLDDQQVYDTELFRVLRNG